MITVTFLNGCILATAEQSLWQYSYNQQLQINGLELPEVFTVDFCNEGDTTTVAMIGSSGVVGIPNELLTSGRDIVAYVFQKSVLTGGITRCEIRIDVLTRPERDDETPTPEQEAVIDQYIAELNEGVEKANESAEDAEAWAVGERGGEPVSESDPTYENNAKYWAENISGQLEDYRTAADQDAIDSAQDGKINALTNLLNKKQSKITANGILKGDGNGGISAAVPGMDYLPTSALYAYRSAIKQDEIDNAQNANIAKNADDIADVKTTADTALQPAALAPYRTAADQDTIDNAQAADIAAINDKIPSTASKNNKLVAWSTFNGQLGTKQAKITANGILKGDGAGGVSAAVAGTDYLAPPALDAYRTAAAQDEIDAAQDEDIADVEAAVDQKAPIIINSASGDIAHFEDGADNMPVKQLSVNVEPIQDLHGYDNPWPAGGGVNLLDPAKCSAVDPSAAYGLTVTHDQATAIWTISGTPTSQSASLAFNFCTYSDFSLSGKGYQVQDFPISGTPIKNFYGFRNEAENKIAIIIDTVANPTVNMTFKVSVAATSQTAWSPYSNICPISGRTSATVTRTGKNLLNLSSLRGGEFDRVRTLPAYNISTNDYLPIKGGQEYVWSQKRYPTGGGRYVRWYDIDKLQIGLVNIYSDSSYPLTAPDNACFARFMWYLPTQYQSIDDIIADEPMIQYGSTASAYEPYAGNTYTIQLGDTVYGGQLDVTQGKMVVDRAMVDLGTLTWQSGWGGFYSSDVIVPTQGDAQNRIVCSHYPVFARQVNIPDHSISLIYGGEGYASNGCIYVKDTDYDNASAFKSAMSGVQLCYELATPLEITLTPTQIDTLIGQNNIWSDAGTVDVDYRADTKLYIDNIHKPTEDDMTADAQIASGKYFIIGNTLYKSTTVIPAGDTIIPGTNCIKTNLAEALNALNA